MAQKELFKERTQKLEKAIETSSTAYRRLVSDKIKYKYNYC